MKISETITASGYIEVTGDSFSIENIKVASPTSIKYEEHTLSRTWNDATGVQHKVNYRVRRKVTWIYSVIGRESLIKIYNILNNKRISSGQTLFNIHTEYFAGDIDMQVEWGTPFNVEAIEGMKNLFNLEIEFIEPVGIKLPTYNQ